MIQNNEVFKIGYITKFRGLRGEVEMSFTDDCFDTGTAEYLVLNMDGILVPFFWEEYKFKNDDTIILKFEDINDQEQASKIVGSSVYYPKMCLPPIEKGDIHTISSYKALTGFRVFKKDNEILGDVIYVDDSSKNILLTIEMPDKKEILIPFHNDFLLDFNIKDRILKMDLPEGLLQLF